jgi:hypothetical protein
MPVFLGRTAVEQRAHVPIAYATLLEAGAMQTSSFAHSVLVVLRGEGIASVKSSVPACHEGRRVLSDATPLSTTPAAGDETDAIEGRGAFSREMASWIRRGDGRSDEMSGLVAVGNVPSRPCDDSGEPSHWGC